MKEHVSVTKTMCVQAKGQQNWDKILKKQNNLNCQCGKDWPL